nr:MAG TPA: protein of unknown function (DUF5361) [Caudoviricetes sp.]
MAEFYNIYDYKKLPLTTVAIFVAGLNDDSRLKRKLQNQKILFRDFLLAGILDRLSLLVWAKTRDGQKNRNRPKMILDLLAKKENNFKTFNSSEDFETKRKELIKKIKGGSKCQI